MGKPKVVLAYSGGLDTSVCIRWFKEAGHPVIAFCAEMGVSGEHEIRSALDLRKSMGMASVEDLEQETLAAVRFLVAERPQSREALREALGMRMLPEAGEHANGGEANGHG